VALDVLWSAVTSGGAEPKQLYGRTQLQTGLEAASPHSHVATACRNPLIAGIKAI